MITYDYFNLTPLYFSDYYTCNELPDPLPYQCQGFFIFTINFSLPPNVTFPSYTTLTVVVNNENLPVAPDGKGYMTDQPVLSTKYTVRPGEILSITLDYEENHDVAGRVYYTTTQTYITRPSGSTGADALRMFVSMSASTDYYKVNHEYYIHSWGKLFGLIGGLYGGIASVFIILFGTTRLSPWGIFQKNVFKSILSGPLNDGFNPPNSIDKSGTPLADPIPTSAAADPAEDFIILGTRLEKLERFLSNYVIDKGLLDSIAGGKIAKKQHEMETGSIVEKGA
ncbi:hypothetical protein BC936DRAFT_136816 [Jimgerdemannia flammicorona]|uniref:Uncharacterized protein n=1 Tax=Jimgerdemannia flammicorona TaxID=994334 RepID=A0A433CYQ9_9FUNG|nr:hypothetical protein BC936DRAFT_136816 [Jimgerdemannia flammicorona]